MNSLKHDPFVDWTKRFYLRPRKQHWILPSNFSRFSLLSSTVIKEWYRPTRRSRVSFTSEKTSLQSWGVIHLVAHFFLDNRDTRISRKSRLQRDCHLERYCNLGFKFCCPLDRRTFRRAPSKAKTSPGMITVTSSTVEKGWWAGPYSGPQIELYQISPPPDRGRSGYEIN